MLGTQEQRTEGIKKQANELIEQAYQRGFKAGQVDNQTFHESICEKCMECLIEQGRNEAWEAAKKIAEDCFNDSKVTKKLFNSYYSLAVFDSFSASEAIEKIKEYENKKQEEEQLIRVGDEVYLSDPAHTSVVTCIFENYVAITAVQITENGRWVVDNIRNLYKTGRHFPEIENVLEKLKEVE